MKKRAMQVYFPPRGKQNWTLQSLLNTPHIRYFSYGRHALMEGLKLAGVQTGDKVLLPSFMCREVLSSVHHLQAQPAYYDVNKELCPCTAPENWPEARAVIAVNYFGFPQNLIPFREYCERTGAVLVEDNAHGLFSRDEKGNFLGTRGDAGIFSLRKTIPMPDGAALVVNDEHLALKLSLQVDFKKDAESPSFRVKQGMRKCVPWMGVKLFNEMMDVVRMMRKLKTGHDILPSPRGAEHELPGDAAPCARLLEYVSQADVEEEIKRRRELYSHVHELLKTCECKPVFEMFSENIAPYGYPFYAEEADIQKIKKCLRAKGLQCFKWPEFPDAVIQLAPDYYKKIWSVQFLW